MITRDEYPPGVPCWIDLSPPDPVAAAEFYSALFGWRLEDRLPPESGLHYFITSLDGFDVAGIGSPSDGPTAPTAWRMYVAVERADEAAGKVQAAGGRVLEDPDDVPGAGRMAVCADPAGAVFNLWEGTGRKGAQLVNAPGTWNFSVLDTTDPEGAGAFYGSVFGWVVRTIDLGADAASMFCLPGYGEFLASIDPDLRRRHAEEAMPEGFSDAVALMSTPTGDGAATGWSTTFAVDDTDAVVNRAVELGAEVVAPPVDLGVVRQAVLQDPQGATFTVSRYQPG